MTIKRCIFTALLSGLVCCGPALGDDCANEMYRRYNPDKCIQTASSESKLSFATAAAITGGTAALVGGTIALLGMSSSGESHLSSATSSGRPSVAHPTLSTYNMVGADVDIIQLASVTNTSGYIKNANTYDEIRVAYSLARGYTGKNSNIAIFDAGIKSWHGRQVAALASGTIAPDATVNHYRVVDFDGEFYSFDQIGEIISSASDANIYNFSWSVAPYASQVKSAQHLGNITSQDFLNALTNAATQNDAIFVWAAGNDYSSQSMATSAMPLHIAELDGHFINVVAWDSSTQQLADFSNACGITKNFCITAPGTNITSTITGESISGTSFATPIVSAAVAVIREAFPYMKSGEITSLLFATARDLGDEGIDETYGHGMLDLERATRPVGTALVPLSENKTVALNTARVSASIGNKIKAKNIKFSFIDSYGRAFETNMNDNIKIQNRGIGYERLGETNTQNIKMGNIEFGFKQSNILASSGFLQTDTNNLTGFIGFNSDTTIGNTTLFHRTTIGFSNPTPSAESIITGFSNIQTASIQIGAKYQDWTFTIGTPETIINGNMYMNTLSGRSNNGDYIYTKHTIDLASRPSMEYAISYKYITAGFVDNAYGTDEIYALAKTKIMF